MFESALEVEVASHRMSGWPSWGLAEDETALIAFFEDDLEKKPYTNIEIHPSLILGVMGNQVVFPENNQLPRDLFACGQMRQAVSLYHSNFQTRIDKMGVVLNYGQTPLQ